jgi:hypothetical protein
MLRASRRMHRNVPPMSAAAEPLAGLFVFGIFMIISFCCLLFVLPANFSYLKSRICIYSQCDVVETFGPTIFIDRGDNDKDERTKEAG